MNEVQINKEDTKVNPYLKTLSTILMVLLMVLFNNKKTMFDIYGIKCFKDRVFELTEGMYLFLKENYSINNAWLIASSLGIDFIVILACFLWCFTIKSWRMILSIGKIYLIRFTMQNLYLMVSPEEILFRYPGFPSLFVPYLVTNDFFFSGHVSLPLLTGLEFRENGFYGLSYLSLFISVFEGMTMVFTRGHYSIDVFAGYLFSLWSFRVTKLYVYLIDESRFGLGSSKE